MPTFVWSSYDIRKHWYEFQIIWRKFLEVTWLSFSDSRINRSPKIIRHLMFPQPSFAKVCMWLVITSYYTPLLWFISKAGKTFGKILVRYYKECLIFLLMLDGNKDEMIHIPHRIDLGRLLTRRKLSRRIWVLKIDMDWYLSNIYFTKYCEVLMEQYVEYFYSRQTCFWCREQVAGMIIDFREGAFHKGLIRYSKSFQIIHHRWSGKIRYTEDKISDEKD